MLDIVAEYLNSQNAPFELVFEKRISEYVHNPLKRAMPSKSQIRYHWSKYLIEIGRFDSYRELSERGVDYCFKCGFDTHTVRAHILPRCEGGSDGVNNIHLLCDFCHTKSEELSEDNYFRWFTNDN